MNIPDNTDPNPVRARAVFNWIPPEGSQGADANQFTATLYSSGAVSLDPQTPSTGLGDSFVWSEKYEAIAAKGGYSDPRNAWKEELREHLLLKATNALRGALGLPAHNATKEFPGTEV